MFDSTPSHQPAIRFRGLGKKYQIDGPQEQYHTLRDAIVNSVKVAVQVILPGAAPSEEF